MLSTLGIVTFAIVVSAIGIYIGWISPLLSKQKSNVEQNSKHQNQYAASGAVGMMGFGADSGSGNCGDGGGSC